MCTSLHVQARTLPDPCLNVSNYSDVLVIVTMFAFNSAATSSQPHELELEFTVREHIVEDYTFKTLLYDQKVYVKRFLINLNCQILF